MLDLALLESTRLARRPLAQRIIAEGFLRFDYRKVDLVVEGESNLPDRPVIFAMNHTDDFSYWPFQYHLHREHDRYTATWVKGKNYEHPITRAFMRSTNNIPIASRGYLLTRDFHDAVGRRPTEDEYRVMRDAVNDLAPPRSALPEALVGVRRSMLGKPFDPAHEPWERAIESLFLALMDRFVALNEEAIRIGLDLLVFPQGTRSKRLSRGHIGLAQMAMHLDVPIVPVGCSGGDVLYPTRSPFCSPGRIVYRIGTPIAPNAIPSASVPTGAKPFARDTIVTYRDRYQALVDRTMDAIDGLLDPAYRYGEHAESDGTRGTERFV